MMKKKDIEFLRVTSLRGPNIWTYRPVLEAWVDIGELEDFPSNTLPGLYERLTAWLPGMIEHRCGVGVRGGFLERLREGTWAGHILEHVAIELQNLAGMKVGFGKARSTAQRGIYKVVIRARNEQVARTALESGRQLLMAAINDEPFDVAATVNTLREMVDDHHLGPSTACIVDAAVERRIPWIRLTEGNLVQLGYGARQRRIWTAETDRTCAIAEGIARDKDLTKSLLQSCGIPVPEGHVVGSAEEAWEAAKDIGLPVVVKPSDGNHGRGVSIELDNQQDVEAAFHLADKEGSEVIVERFIRGNEHRVLVVGGRVVAAARGETAWITGDGHGTVAQLVDTQLNTDPRRGLTEDFPLNRIMLDGDPAVLLELARQHLTPDSVPDAGRKVLIQRNGNVAFDVTDRVHPDVAEVVSIATRVIGLDIAGVDLVAEDISRPMAEQGAAIVEINAGPGLLMHLKPAEGEPRPIGEAIIDHLFPQGPDDECGRIPVIGITGSQGTTLIARLIARLVHLSGKYVGLACRDGMFLDRRQVESGDRSTWKAGQRLLINRAVEAAVFENPCETILGEGLPYDRCLVGVVTDVTHHPALDAFHVHDADHVYNVLRTQVDVVLPEGTAVLNAGDPRVADMADLCDGAVIFYGVDPEWKPIAEHRARAGRAVTIVDRQIVLASGSRETPLASLSALPLTRDGAPEDRLQAVLAAVAAAWALDIPTDLIRAGIEHFDFNKPALSSPGSRLPRPTASAATPTSA